MDCSARSRLRYRYLRGDLIRSARAPIQPVAVNPSAATMRGRFPLTLSFAAVTCALMPWYTIRWHYGPLPTTLLETGILLTLLMFALESWRQRFMPGWLT